MPEYQLIPTDYYAQKNAKFLGAKENQNYRKEVAFLLNQLRLDPNNALYMRKKEHTRANGTTKKYPFWGKARSDIRIVYEYATNARYTINLIDIGTHNRAWRVHYQSNN